MYQTILVPVDLSNQEQGCKALEIARQIGDEQSRVIALYVASELRHFITGQLPEGVVENNLAIARQELVERAKPMGAEAEIRSGHPPTVILETAKEVGADIIVVGSNRPGLQHFLLGSTAASLVRHAECAVLVDR